MAKGLSNTQKIILGEINKLPESIYNNYKTGNLQPINKDDKLTESIYKMQNAIGELMINKSIVSSNMDELTDLCNERIIQLKNNKQ